MSSWDDRPIVTRYTKKLLGIFEDEDVDDKGLNEKETPNATINQKITPVVAPTKPPVADPPPQPPPEPIKKSPSIIKKKPYEYPYTRKQPKVREDSMDSFKSMSIELPTSPKSNEDKTQPNKQPPPSKIPKRLPLTEQPLIIQPGRIQF